MTADTVDPEPRPTRLAELSKDYGLTKEIGRVLGSINDSADAFEAIGTCTLAAAELGTEASVHELRIAAFRLRSSALSLARLLDEVSSAAGRLEGLAWAKQALDLDNEGDADEESETEGGAS